MKKPLPNHQRLREVLDYDPDTGDLTWKVRLSNRALAGAKALPGDAGYKRLRIDGAPIQAHRAVWCWVFGEYPIAHIDHIDGDRANNRLGNLRDVSQSVNMQNIRGPKSDNRLGVLGVIARDSRFRARIHVDGKTRYLGTYDTKEEAGEAYLAAKRRLHEGCAV